MSEINSINRFTVAYFSPLLPIISDSLKKISSIFESAIKLSKDYKIAESLGIVGNVILGVATFYTMFKGYERIFLKKDISKKVDGGLTVVESLGTLAYGTTSAIQGVQIAASMMQGFQKVALVAKNILNASNILSIFSLVLSSVSIVKSSKSLVENRLFLKNVRELKTQDKSYLTAMTILVGMKGIKKHTSIKRADLIGRINQRFDALDRNSQEKAAEEIYNAIIGKIQANMTSDGLSLLSGSLSIVGSSLMIALPLAPIGLGINALSSLTSVIQFSFNYFKNKEFEKLLPSQN